MFEGHIKPKYLLVMVLISITLYFMMDTVYTMAPEGIKEPITVKVGDNQNTINLNNTSINIPASVTKGLTNLGTGAAAVAGIKAGVSLAKTSGLYTTAKLGLMTAGAVIAGSTVTVVNTINSLDSSKVTTSEATKSSSNIPFPNNSPTSSAFSIEPGADLDTILSLLNANNVLHICITYLIIIMLILYIADNITSKKWNLLFIKRIFGVTTYNLIIKWFTFTSRYNKIWIGIAWLLLLIASFVTLYVSSYLSNNIEILADIINNKKI
uniref:Uncharacterized protein n=1 Tax=Epichloe typhina TaxID=5113 RepID=A0A1J0D046_EPITY|nr:hypothetical protein [Epichloe typhina]APB96775.1 hypothetical protein [Epichloe typhina]